MAHHISTKLFVKGVLHVILYKDIKAMELMDKAGLANHQDPCGMEELKKIQDVWPDYKIKLFSKEHYCTIIFEEKASPRKLSQKFGQQNNLT
uniref:Uncharacterized protein n=1 Tax=Romanomermis culicivorax TaxID=13658 RepID=A0A915IH19_ROMCU